MEQFALQRLTPKTIPSLRNNPVDEKTMAIVEPIVKAIRERGEEALLEYSVKFGDLTSTSDPYIFGKERLKKEYDSLPVEQQELLVRTARRVRTFAEAQRQSITEVVVNVPGGRCGQDISPVEVAGCYAPGGRYPLPSSVLMTAATAFAAGVGKVVLASPKPSPVTAAAAYVAGADSLLIVGGAQAIAAMAYGVGLVPACDVIVGPGNRFVTAAKKLVSGLVAIDMLAGPSELLVLADHTANPAVVASDLLAQAEHDTVALPILVTTSEELATQVDEELTKQLSVLPTAATAAVSIRQGFTVICPDMASAIEVSNTLAPEHLEVITANVDEVAKQLNHYGGLFIGEHAAEVLGDYGAGPNHTLPTGGTARYTGGLSVFNFLRIRTWMKIDRPSEATELVEDSVMLAELEGLIGHSRSAMHRREGGGGSKQVAAKNTDPLRLIRRDFHNMMKYSPVQPLDVLAKEIGMPADQLAKLDANENLYGPLPGAVSAIQQSVLHIYPDPAQTSLRAAVSRFTGYPSEWCLCGAGSDELLDVVTRLVDPDKILVSTPTFAMYDFFARLSKTQCIDVPLGPPPSFELDVPALREQIRLGAKIVFLASPNNPTGQTVPNSVVEELCQEECLVVIDEAYAEFAEESALPLVKKHSNLMVMRTFSKWAGLAGVRCGYVVCHPSLVSAMMQIKQPYNINVAADASATYSLDHSEVLMVAVEAMVMERHRLMTQLEQITFLHPLPSQSNFVLVEVTDPSVAPLALQAALRKHGVLVRCYAGGSCKALDRFIRVSCGRPQDSDRLMSVLLTMQGASDDVLRSNLLSLETKEPCCVLWDMDGVMAEVSGSYREAIIQTAHHFNVTVTNEMIQAAKNAGNANNDWVLAHRLINQDSVSLAAVTKVFQALYLGENGVGGLRDVETLIPTKALLEKLAAKYPMAVVTGRPKEDCDYFLQLHGLDHLFKVRVVAEDGLAKPDPFPVDHALAQLGLADAVQSGAYAFMIGDTPDDIRAAVRAKGTVVALGFLPPSGSSSSSRLAKRTVAKALYEAGAARVMVSMGQLEELTLGTPYHIYGAPSQVET